MAVENRYVVIRHGVEVQTFMEKKTADEYDKMLDIADNLTEMLKSIPFELSEEAREELSIYLAKNREELLVALQAKKAKAPPQKKIVDKEVVAIDKEVVAIDKEIVAVDKEVAKKTVVKAKSKPKPKPKSSTKKEEA
jgi:dsDNA-binding SOS-regulon protein